MIVYSHRQRLFGSLLSNNVLTQLLINLLRSRYLARLEAWLRDRSLLFFDDFTTEIDTLIADIDTTGTCYEPLHLILALSAK